MMLLNGLPVSSEISRFQLYLHYAKENYLELEGSLYNPKYGFGIDFLSIGQLFTSLEWLFDYVQFPMASQETRNFYPPSKDKKDSSYPLNIAQAPGSPCYAINDATALPEANFILHIQFRQNATWQGLLTKISTGETQRFSSELELVKLLMSSLEMGM